MKEASEDNLPRDLFAVGASGTRQDKWDRPRATLHRHRGTRRCGDEWRGGGVEPRRRDGRAGKEKDGKQGQEGEGMNSEGSFVQIT